MGRLPTGVAPIYTAQIIIMSQPEVAGELRAWAAASGRHASDLQREVLEAGWKAIKPKLQRRTPANQHPSEEDVAAWVERVDRSKRPTPAQRRAATAARRANAVKARATEQSGA